MNGIKCGLILQAMDCIINCEHYEALTHDESERIKSILREAKRKAEEEKE